MKRALLLLFFTASVASAQFIRGGGGGGSSLIWLTPCDLATTGDLGDTYSNGTAGVGATLTGTAFGLLAVDGVNVTVGQRILVKNESAPSHNGVYTVTTVGDVGTDFVLTRATDFDTSAEMVSSDSFVVLYGSTQANTAWSFFGSSITVGTTSVPIVGAYPPGFYGYTANGHDTLPAFDADGNWISSGIEFDNDDTAGDKDAAVYSETQTDAKLALAKHLKSYLQFTTPRTFSAAAPVQTSDSTVNYYGQAKFSNSTDQATNFVEYRCIVPEDLDTGVALRARFKFRLSGADTGKHRYVISMADTANSASSGGTLTNTVNMDFTGDASGASGDIEGTGLVTLTSWAGSLTPGDQWVIRIARDGDDGTNDTSTVDSYSGTLEIEYGATQ